MESNGMPRLLFGDNQFFGINHMSEDKARTQQMRFQDLDAIMSVLNSAYDSGVTTFMCTTHARVEEICERIRQSPTRYQEMQFYPCLPYAHKYANAITENGLLGAIQHFLPEEGMLDTLVRGTSSFARKDIEGVSSLLVDAELKMFTGLRTPVIWLQNIVVDLLSGLGFVDAFRVFADHVRTRYRAEPGFITMNLPRVLDDLDRVGVANPIICSNINKIGFRMSGGTAEYMNALEKRPFRAVAMSVFASGAIPPREAIEWVCGIPNLESIVFGASSLRNIRSTVDLVNHYWNGPARTRP